MCGSNPNPAAGGRKFLENRDNQFRAWPSAKKIVKFAVSNDGLTGCDPGSREPPGPCCWRSREQWHECGRVQCECEQHGYECECELLVAPIQARTKTNATEGPDRAAWQKITTDAEGAGRAAECGGFDSFRSEHCRPKTQRQTR